MNSVNKTLKPPKKFGVFLLGLMERKKKTKKPPTVQKQNYFFMKNFLTIITLKIKGRKIGRIKSEKVEDSSVLGKLETVPPKSL